MLSTPNNNQQFYTTQIPRSVLSATNVSATCCYSSRRHVDTLDNDIYHTMQQTSLDDSFAHLSRLSQKAGVQATLILSRETGAIVRSSGLVSRDESSNSESTLPASNGLTDDRNDGAMPNAEHVAEVVWKFAKAAGDMLQELSNLPEDDVKLLRLRSKNKEYVIFPGTYSHLALLPESL
jgi:dynein light chain roadblock-type